MSLDDIDCEFLIVFRVFNVFKNLYCLAERNSVHRVWFKAIQSRIIRFWNCFYRQKERNNVVILGIGSLTTDHKCTTSTLVEIKFSRTGLSNYYERSNESRLAFTLRIWFATQFESELFIQKTISVTPDPMCNSEKRGIFNSEFFQVSVLLWTKPSICGCTCWELISPNTITLSKPTPHYGFLGFYWRFLSMKSFHKKITAK